MVQNVFRYDRDSDGKITIREFVIVPLHRSTLVWSSISEKCPSNGSTGRNCTRRAANAS